MKITKDLSSAQFDPLTKAIIILMSVFILNPLSRSDSANPCKTPFHLNVMVTSDELDAIQRRMAEAGTTNAGAFVRKMALNTQGVRDHRQA